LVRTGVLPSGLNATLVTMPSWPMSGWAEGLSALGIPEPHGPIPTRRGEALAVGAEDYALHGELMALSGRGAEQERETRRLALLAAQRVQGFEPLEDLLSTPEEDRRVRFFSCSGRFTYRSRMRRMAPVRKPPVPQAGSNRISPGRGSIRSTMKAVTARGV
jgi:hypothetical protein